MESKLTLDGRLLCASIVADEIHPKTGYQPEACYYKKAGFLRKPTIIIEGLEKIDACLVGETHDGVVVAFRGTLMPKMALPNILDWLQDFLAIPEAVHGLPGKVHMGFYNSVKAVWNPMLAAVKEQMTRGTKLYVTGHSKGASMATLASIMLKEAGYNPEAVITFACPHSGDGAFASGYRKQIAQRTYTNHLDMIPFLPPSTALAKEMEKIPKIGWLMKDFEKWGYTSAATDHIFIKKDGSLIDKKKHFLKYEWAIASDLNTIKKTAGQRGGLVKILSAHMPGCGGGYMKGVCGDAVCSDPDCSK